MKPVEPRRPPRDDETPTCTFIPDVGIPDPRLSVPTAETPLCTYFIEDRAPPNEACLLLRVERTGPRRRDETPPYVFSCETFPPHAEEELDPAGIRFGDWLVRRALITRADLFCALERGRSRRVRVGDALVELGLLSRGRVEEEARAYGAFTAFQDASPLMTPRE